MAGSDRQRLGGHYESLALSTLGEAGLRLVARNFRCRRGEIDLVMSDGNTLVFVEVRYRTRSAFGSAIDSITLAKQRRIVRAAEWFLGRNRGYRNAAIRFDVVGIDRDDGSTHRVHWIKDAFRPG